MAYYYVSPFIRWIEKLNSCGSSNQIIFNELPGWTFLETKK